MLSVWAVIMLGAQVPAILAHFTVGKRWGWLRVSPAVSLAAMILHIQFGREPFTPRMLPAYLLAGLSFAWAIPAWLHPNAGKSKRRNLCGVAQAVLLAVSMLPLAVFPFYPLPDTTGAYLVRSTVYNLRQPDAAAAGAVAIAEPIIVEVWFPDTVMLAELPLVLIAPGNLASRQSSESLARELASRGMRAASLDHPGQSLYTRLPDGGIILPKRLYLEEAIALSSRQLSPVDAAEVAAPWSSSRAADLQLAIACLEGSAETGCPAQQRLTQTAKVGVIAFGIGAGPALDLCRASRCSALVLVDSIFPQSADENGIVDVLPGETAVLLLDSEQHARYLSSFVLLPGRFLEIDKASLFHATLPKTGTLGLTDLALRAPLLSGVVDGVPANRESLRAANHCLAAFLTYYLLPNSSPKPWQGVCNAELVVHGQP